MLRFPGPSSLHAAFRHDSALCGGFEDSGGSSLPCGPTKRKWSDGFLRGSFHVSWCRRGDENGRGAPTDQGGKARPCGGRQPLAPPIGGRRDRRRPIGRVSPTAPPEYSKG